MSEHQQSYPDIVERLRAHVKDRGGSSLANGAWDMMLEAANEIERLEFEYERADQSAKRLGAKWKEAVEGLRDPAQTVQPLGLQNEIDRLRAGIQSIVDCKNPMTRSAVREACADILRASSITSTEREATK